jgi:hypothetical protein
VPTLLELQSAFRRSLVARHDGDAVAMLAAHVPANRIDIYRNTFITGLTNALRLSYPAVHRLVGDDFFAAAAADFIAQAPPRTAYLNHYGAAFPEFLQQFPPAAGLAYLADVARLEWAVNTAIHAPDREPLALEKLAALAAGDQAARHFVPHPSVSLLRVRHPADDIWRAILNRDDAEMAELAFGTAPIHLLVQRLPIGVEVVRFEESEWRFMAALCAGQPLQMALDNADCVDVGISLAMHLAAGRFVEFTLAESEPAVDAARRGRASLLEITR